MRRILWKMAAAVALALLVPLAFPDLGLLVPFVLFGAAVGAKLEFTQAELDGLLERAVGAREEKEWRDKVLKANYALDDDVGLFVLEGGVSYTAGPDCSDLCRVPFSWPNWIMRIEPGWIVEVHPGDPKRGRPYRRLSPDESKEAVSVQAAVRVFNELLALKPPQDNVARVQREETETQRKIEELEGRLLEHAQEKAAASEKALAAQRPLDDFLSSRPAAYRRAAIEFAKLLNATRGAGAPYSNARPLAFGDYEPSDTEREGAPL